MFRLSLFLFSFVALAVTQFDGLEPEILSVSRIEVYDTLFDCQNSLSLLFNVPLNVSAENPYCYYPPVPFFPTMKDPMSYTTTELESFKLVAYPVDDSHVLLDVSRPTIDKLNGVGGVTNAYHPCAAFDLFLLGGNSAFSAAGSSAAVVSIDECIEDPMWMALHAQSRYFIVHGPITIPYMSGSGLFHILKFANEAECDDGTSSDRVRDITFSTIPMTLNEQRAAGISCVRPEPFTKETDYQYVFPRFEMDNLFDSDSLNLFLLLPGFEDMITQSDLNSEISLSAFTPSSVCYGLTDAAALDAIRTIESKKSSPLKSEVTLTPGTCTTEAEAGVGLGGFYLAYAKDFGEPGVMSEFVSIEINVWAMLGIIVVVVCLVVFAIGLFVCCIILCRFYLPLRKCCGCKEAAPVVEEGENSEDEMGELQFLSTLPKMKLNSCGPVRSALFSFLWFIVSEIREFQSLLIVIYLVYFPPQFAKYMNEDSDLLLFYAVFILIVVCIGMVVFDVIARLILLGWFLFYPLPMAIGFELWRECFVRRVIFGVFYLAMFIAVTGFSVFLLIVLFTTEYCEYVTDPNELAGQTCNCVINCWYGSSTSEYLNFFASLVSGTQLLFGLLNVINYNGASSKHLYDKLTKYRKAMLLNRIPEIRFPFWSIFISTPADVISEVATTLSIVESPEDVKGAQTGSTTSHHHWLWLETLRKKSQFVFLRKFFFGNGEEEAVESRKTLFCFSSWLRKRFCFAFVCCCCGNGGSGESPNDYRYDPIRAVKELESMPSTPPTLIRGNKTSCGWIWAGFKSLAFFVLAQIRLFAEYVVIALVAILPPILGASRASVVDEWNSTIIKPALIGFACLVLFVDTCVRLLYIGRKNLFHPLRMATHWSQFSEFLLRRILIVILDALLLLTCLGFFVVLVRYYIVTSSSSHDLVMSIIDKRFTGDSSVLIPHSVSADGLRVRDWTVSGLEYTACGPPVDTIRGYGGVDACSCLLQCVVEETKVPGWEEIVVEIVRCLAAILQVLFHMINAFGFDSASAVPYIRELKRFDEEQEAPFPTVPLSILKTLLKSPDRVIDEFLTVLTLVRNKLDLEQAEKMVATSHLSWGWLGELSDNELEYLRWFFLRRRFKEEESTSDLILYGIARFFYRRVFQCCHLSEIVSDYEVEDVQLEDVM